jgi:glycine cleavage system H lipoate-binding protein
MNSVHESGEVNGGSAKRCWWMQAGVLDYKLCDRDYDCEHCPIDDVLHGRSQQSPGSQPPLAEAVGPAALSRAITSLDGRDGLGNDALFFHPGHTWARIEAGGTVRTGIDDFAQQLLGRAYFVTLPSPQSALRRGEPCWQFAHQAGVTALVSPVSGIVLEVNDSLGQRPALLNRDPYGEGWTVLLEPNDLKNCLRSLWYGEQARRWQEGETERLQMIVNEALQAEPDVAGTTMTDGGLFNLAFRRALNSEQMRQVLERFFAELGAEPERNNTHSVPQGR